jgi:hypothetical protein
LKLARKFDWFLRHTLDNSINHSFSSRAGGGGGSGGVFINSAPASEFQSMSLISQPLPRALLVLITTMYVYLRCQRLSSSSDNSMRRD